MSDAIAICNRALSEMGSQSSIADFNEKSTEALECRKFYEPVRDWLLGKAHWNFCRRAISLALLKQAAGSIWTDAQPQPPWGYSFAYPSDCIKVRYLTSGMSFIVAGDKDVSGNAIKVILTDDPQPIAVYTAKVIDTSIWDPEFTEALVYSLAGRLAIPLSGDKDLMRLNTQLANALIEEARAFDANEGTQTQQIDADWITVRGVTYESSVID
jgi:hypothetical protein